jgi:hypothetical protein
VKHVRRDRQQAVLRERVDAIFDERIDPRSVAHHDHAGARLLGSRDARAHRPVVHVDQLDARHQRGFSYQITPTSSAGVMSSRPARS